MGQDRFREDLDAAECRRLLDAGTVGRLGFTTGALPAIVPVPYTMRNGVVLIAATRGDPVVDAVRGAVVAFEVDDYDPAAMTGWSVTVVGPSRISGTAGAGHPPTWPEDASSSCYITVRPGLVRGWRETAGKSVPPPRGPVAEYVSRFPPVG
jgi:hypothetical protein